MSERRGPLVVTILGAVGMLIAVSGWLLNDRRRRVEECRQQTGTARAGAAPRGT